MPDSQVADLKGGRPRKYPSIEDHEALEKRVVELTALLASRTETAAGSTEYPVDAASSDDKKFIQDCIVAYVAAEGASVVGDVSLAGTIAVVGALLAVRDYICQEADTIKRSRYAQLKEAGVLR